MFIYNRHREEDMDNSSTERRDEQVLELRAAGQAFTAIAKTMGYERAAQCRDAFTRALRRRPVEERAALRLQEMARLDAIDDVFRSSPGLDEEETAQRLRAVDQLRTKLLAD